MPLSTNLVIALVLILLAAILLFVVFRMVRDGAGGNRSSFSDTPSGRTGLNPHGSRDPDSDELPGHGLVLAGFDDEYAAPVRIDMPAEKLADRKYGFSIGRHPDLVDETIDHPDVSRRHVRFFWSGGAFHAEDLNTTHGTWVREQRLQPFRPVPIRPGDELRLGRLKLDLGR